MLNFGASNFFGGRASTILWVTGELFCSPNDFRARSLVVRGMTFPGIVKLINLLKSFSAHISGLKSFYESRSKTLYLWGTTRTSGVDIWAAFTLSANRLSLWACFWFWTMGIWHVFFFLWGRPTEWMKFQYHLLLLLNVKQTYSYAPWETTEEPDFRALIWWAQSGSHQQLYYHCNYYPSYLWSG